MIKLKKLLYEINRKYLNVKTDHFHIEPPGNDIVKNAFKIFLGNKWFTNALIVTKDWNPKYSGKWHINRHEEAFKLNFPTSEKYYNNIQDSLNDLERRYLDRIDHNREK